MCRIWAKTCSARLSCARSAQAENETLRKKCDEMTLKLDEATKKVRRPLPPHALLLLCAALAAPC